MRNSFTDQERHSFILGIADGFNPLKSPYDASLPAPSYLFGEMHYYKTGRAIGLWLFIMQFVIIAWFFLQ